MMETPQITHLSEYILMDTVIISRLAAALMRASRLTCARPLFLYRPVLVYLGERAEEMLSEQKMIRMSVIVGGTDVHGTL
jgi:hypothetical protein